VGTTDVEGETSSTAAATSRGPGTQVAGQPRDRQRTYQLVLATIWLLDAVLQLQPFMFARGASGFSGMLNSSAAGNPGWIAHSITWNASNVSHHPVLGNTVFALVQFLIAFGLVWRRSVKPALALSIVWSLGVWWFGEGLGGIAHGVATPFGGGPGSVLFYAVLAVLLWPSARPDGPFVAARSVGVSAAKAIWVALWGLLAVLAVVGSGRSPRALHDLVAMYTGEPGWLAHIDRLTESLVLRDGAAAAIALAVTCVVVAVGVYFPPPATKAALVLGMTVFGVIWVATQDFGGILAGGATDPNSGPLVILLALLYWPVGPARSPSVGPMTRSAEVTLP
jgi:hypothetical protein